MPTATAVAFVVLYYGLEIAERPYLRRALIVLFTSRLLWRA
jgi:hypothetical protein